MAQQRDDLEVVSEADLTVDDTARRFPISAIIANGRLARKVEIFFEDAQCRVRRDGTDPTSTVGDIYNPFDRTTLMSLIQAWRFRAIRTGSTNATAHYKVLA